MWHLIKSEYLRFRRLGAALAIGHLFLLKALSAFGDLFAGSMAKVAVGLLVYAATGLIFGLYQMGSYKRANQWAYLIHRPLAPRRIFLALACAAVLWFATVLVLPQLLMTLYLDALTPQWVDLRHYALVPYLLGLTLSFYLAGCFVSLSPVRGSFLVLLLPYFFLTRQAEGLWIFLPQLVVVVWLAYLAFAVFKPDLSSPLRRPLAVAGSALPVQYALFWILVAGSALVYQSLVVFREEGLTGYATHAWDDHFPEGTYLHAQYLRGADALEHGLAGAGSERARHLAKQVELAEVLALRPQVQTPPRRGQLLFADGPLVLLDREAGLRWVFRHDRMLFQGLDADSGQPRGWLGPEGKSEPGPAGTPGFGQVPVVAGGRFAYTRRHLYELDSRRGRLDLRFEAGAGERLISAFEQEGAVLALVTDRALYLFDPRQLREETGSLEPTARLALPGELSDLAALHIAELLDGYLASFVFGTRSEAGYGAARQVVVEVGVDGGQEVVAERALGPGWATGYRYRGYILSPLLHYGHDLVWSWIAPAGPGRVSWREMARREVPASVHAWALLAACLSGLLTAFVAPARDLSPRERWTWMAAAFALGIPAFLSFLLLTRRNEALAPAKTSLLPWSWREAS